MVLFNSSVREKAYKNPMKTFKPDGNVSTTNVQNLENESASGLFLYNTIFSHCPPKKIVLMQTRTVRFSFLLFDQRLVLHDVNSGLQP